MLTVDIKTAEVLIGWTRRDSSDGGGGCNACKMFWVKRESRRRIVWWSEEGFSDGAKRRVEQARKKAAAAKQRAEKIMEEGKVEARMDGPGAWKRRNLRRERSNRKGKGTGGATRPSSDARLLCISAASKAGSGPPIPRLVRGCCSSLLNFSPQTIGFTL
nr:hypothetical protein CFP56_43888 [Quercus suber]